MVDYDVIICGAGPSGSTTAKFLAEKGYEVALLEKGRFPRDKLCGGALRLSVDEFDFLTTRLKKIESPPSFEVRMHPPSLENAVQFASRTPVMRHVRRIEFDEMMANMATDAGAELIESTRVKSTAASRSKASVYLENGKELSSHMIVGAGGMHCVTARYLREKEGLPSSWPRSDIGLVIAKEYDIGEYKIEDFCGRQRTSHIFLKPNGIRGYGWLFPKKEALNVGFGAFWADMKRIDMRKAFDLFLESLKKQGLFPKKQKAGHIKAAMLPLSGPIKRTYTDRILVTGDAAGFVSPLSGDGLYYAVSSGEFAAKTAIEALEAGRYDRKMLGSYQEKWQNAWGLEIAVLKVLTKNLHHQTERFIRYVSLDKELRKNMQDIYTGREDPSKLLWKMTPRVFMDFLRFEPQRESHQQIAGE